MARNYAALPHEYLEEMDALSDAEFGRLTRALIKYSKTGEPIALCGNERFYANRVMAQEDRFKKNYRELSDIRSSAGKMGAAARWQNGKAIVANGKNGYTETNTKTETETNTKTNLSLVMNFVMDRVNPTPSRQMVEEIEHFCTEMGPEVCLRAVQIALDAGKPRWSYIRAILRDKQAQGVKSIQDWDALAEKGGDKRDGGGSKGDSKAVLDLLAL